ncbi:AMP-dependent synthetase/ligase [Polaromonas sp. SM01]|uniref:AMP-dependent synthetase/ligase n=1 Tax=Polaromonas sp. SM01 TaxID=3085630 RepID=UPI0029813578|nr:AMP-binding protein [Polaromonas sp. SM01]MDW5441896.1 AMP-binding protein [Polaromonas sp. SM01]
MTPAIATINDVQTLPQLLAFRARLSPQGEAYRSFDNSSGQWLSLNWADTLARVTRWSRALAASGLPNAARVAILLPNGLEAMSMDQAALATGCVPVPLHAIDNPGSIAYIVADCEASLLILDHAALWEKICAVGQPFPDLKTVVVVNGDLSPPATDTGDAVTVLSLADWLALGRDNTPLPAPPEPHDLAAIVYTSGTTGKPKGVMLTHRNVVANVQAVMARVLPTTEDVFLSFLPLSHTFERTAGYYLAIAAGSCVAYARSVAQLGEDLKSVRPTVLISVPRIYERVYAKLQEKLSPSPLKMRLFAAAQTVGWRRFCAAQGLPMPDRATESAAAPWTVLPWALLEYLVAKPLLAQLGGRVRVAVSGGAPLSPAIAQCFLGLGLPLLQGYGLTETSPVVAANGLDDNDPATVGRALSGIEVRIGDKRELQVRGPSVMKGYWKRPEDSARILSADGWLATGDQAEITHGRLRILGRIKEIIVTSTGEKVPPGDLELAITADPLFEQAFVVGENRPFIACVAVLQRDEWKRLAQALTLDPQDPASLHQPAAERAALARIEKQMGSFARYAVPRAVCLTLTPWTLENSFMTPTLKLKRNNLMAHFEPQIDAMYQKPSSR